MSENQPIFCNFDADNPEQGVTEIESLCVICCGNGITRLLLTKIPFYKDVIIISFACENCGHQNNEIQSGNKVPDKGVEITLKVDKQADLNRQVVKSDYTCVKIVELDFEIPSKSQKGEITTVEGIIDRSIQGLQHDQPIRKIDHPDVAEQLDGFIEKLKKLKDGTEPFTLVLEDISGNSFVENPNAPQKDSQCATRYFVRNKEQNHELGIFTKEEVGTNSNNALLNPIAEEEFTLEDLQGEVLQFPTNCNNCNAPCVTNMKVTNIPHFKEVVIMATTCDGCGNRTNEVKSCAGIEPKGIRIEVDVNNTEDLSRDLLKSETCQVHIPQLELEVGATALNGRFTTVEGLLVAMKEQLNDNIFNDSQNQESKNRLDQFLKKIDEIIEGCRQVTLILDDPAGNSYVQSMRDDGKPDDALRMVQYERSHEQNEDLGLNDMKTENYEEP